MKLQFCNNIYRKNATFVLTTKKQGGILQSESRKNATKGGDTIDRYSEIKRINR